MTTLESGAWSGLTSAEAHARLRQYGFNALDEARPRLLWLFLRKFYGLIPAMLGATLLLQLLLGKTVDALIIALVLVGNAIISFTYERKAQNSLALLQQRLIIQTRVLRDGEWRWLEARQLVPGDVVRLRVGDLVPADIHLVAGQIAVDQATLTGEGTLINLGPGDLAYAAGLVKRGEGTGEVTATGLQTAYHQTAQLVQTAKPANHGDAFVQTIVAYLMGFTALLVAGVLLYALWAGLPLADVLLFTLALLVAAIPVSLPVTFTLASAVGSRELAQHGVLTTRLPAIKEAAGMDILCSDKTGTLTKNELTLVALHTYHHYTPEDLLRYAVLACDDATQDPIDLAILQAARAAHLDPNPTKRMAFIPFDPATKRTEALIRRKKKKPLQVIKGSPYVVNRLIRETLDLTPDVERLAAGGSRCLAIAKGREGKPPKIVGLLALQDPPREEAAGVVTHLKELGVQVVMVTGDGLATARTIAHKIGIEGAAYTAEALETQDVAQLPAHMEEVAVYANIYPEGKYRLVQALQAAGHIVGMTGDGINDAPAIKQAEIGVAVNNATDITKSAASFVLTGVGLKDVPAAILVGRRIFQRMSIYTLNKIIKTLHMGLFLSLGLILTGALLVRPTQILLVVLANDLVSMALTTDHVRPSPKPDRWRVHALAVSGLGLALCWLVFSFVVYFVARDRLGLAAPELQTLLFLILGFVAQANVYLIRERRHLWRSRPSRWLLAATVVGLLLLGFLALGGVMMAPLSLPLVLGLLMATVAATLAFDFLKVRLFAYCGLA